MTIESTMSRPPATTTRTIAERHLCGPGPCNPYPEATLVLSPPLFIDAVTSIGGIELRAGEWGVDLGDAGTQKCLGVAPGLAPLTISDHAFERRVEKPSSWYLDLGLPGGYVGEASEAGRRTYHHTEPTAMVRSLHAGLRRIADEGLEKVWDRHAKLAGLCRTGSRRWARPSSRRRGRGCPS